MFHLFKSKLVKGRGMRNTKGAKSTKNIKAKGDHYPSILQKGDSVTTIYVGNLSFKRKEGGIKKMFQKFGKVIYVKLILSHDEKSKGIAFVQMSNREHANEAIEKLNGREVDGRTLKVSIAAENETGNEKKKVSFNNIDKISPPHVIHKEADKKVLKKKKEKGLSVLFDYLNSKT